MNVGRLEHGRRSANRQAAGGGGGRWQRGVLRQWELTTHAVVESPPLEDAARVHPPREQNLVDRDLHRLDEQIDGGGGQGGRGPACGVYRLHTSQPSKPNRLPGSAQKAENYKIKLAIKLMPNGLLELGLMVVSFDSCTIWLSSITGSSASE